jgi:hypothetical protein
LGLSGPVPSRVGATTKEALLGLLDDAIEAGWSFRGACLELELAENRAYRWMGRRSAGELEDRAPGGDPLHGLLSDEVAAIVALYHEWGDIDRSHRKLAHRGSYLDQVWVSPSSVRRVLAAQGLVLHPLARPGTSVRKPFPEWVEYRPNQLWIYDTTHFGRAKSCLTVIEDLVSRKWIADILSSEETSTQVQIVFTDALEAEGLLDLIEASGSFRAIWEQCPIYPVQRQYLKATGVVPNSACRSVVCEAEKVVEALLGRVHFCQHAPGPRASPIALVEQHGLFDFTEGAEQLAHTHVQAGLGRLSTHEPGQRQGEYAVKDVDADLVVGPVEHGVERDDSAILHLAKVRLDVVLGSIRTNDVGHFPVVVVGEEDPLAEELFFERPPGHGVLAEAQAERGRPITAQRRADDPGDPAGLGDAGDLGLDGVAVLSGLAPLESLSQSHQRSTRLGQCLVEAAGLLGVKGL